MVKTNSPYYVTIPLGVDPNPFDYYISYIYIWSGLQSAEPITPEYQQTRQNPSGSVANDKINISNLVNDFIDFTPQSNNATALIDGVNQVWVSVYYEGFIADVSQGKTLALLDSAVSGYTYGLDGENATVPANNILLYGTEFKVNRDSGFILPLIGNDTNVTVISYPLNEINSTILVPSSLDSADIISYLWVNCAETTTDKYILINYNGVDIVLLVEIEYRYTPINIHFKNKEGCQQVLTFFKERKDNISVTSEQYNGSGGQPLAGKHQFVDYNVNSKSTFTVSSGFVDEENNETFKQLLLSDKIWQYDNTNFIPLNINSKTLEYKNRVNDRLINYVIDFAYSFNDINTI